jgi:predicted nucleotidyltransferase component of viral defense system
MTPRKPTNIPASIRQRLFDVAKTAGEDFQYTLMRYGLERFLYRLSRSTYAASFVLKGAVLFQIWGGRPHRATKDVDLLASGVPDVARITRMMREIIKQEVEKDGLVFLADSVQAEQIKEDDVHQGVRVRLEALLGNARIPIQIDLGFGDAITPAPVDMTYPTLLSLPAPRVKCYPRETVIAEKFHAMVHLGMANSRMKDFFDLWTLAKDFEFDGPTLCAALRATFDRRETPIPTSTPVALTSEFADDTSKRSQWAAFLRRLKIDVPALVLSTTVGLLSEFLVPLSLAAAAGEPFDKVWLPPGPWTPKPD